MYLLRKAFKALHIDRKTTSQIHKSLIDLISIIATEYTIWKLCKTGTCDDKPRSARIRLNIEKLQLKL
uniref:Uncharacterized protein n=1 Tax=Lepeophtheirus salmonis TaxID=72036 RepID=A0A0K2V9G4_LEPSM